MFTRKSYPNHKIRQLAWTSMDKFTGSFKHFGVAARAYALFVSDPLGVPYGITVCLANY